MLRADRLLLMLLLVSLSSCLLYKRQKARWPFSPSSPQSGTSQLFKMRKQLEAVNRTRWRYGSRADSCRAHPLAIELQPPLKLADECGTTSVRTYGCRGGCSSYSQVDPRNSTNIIHTCSCCQPMEHRWSYAMLPCQNGNNIRISFQEVVTCSCRPCYADDPPRDYLRFDELLARPALETSLPIG